MILDQLKYGFIQFPKRLWRVVLHLFFQNDFLRSYRSSSCFTKGIVWILELVVLVLDLLWVGDIYQLILLLIHKKIRSLQIEEIELARTIFPKGLKLELVRLHSKSKWVSRFNAWAFVSFNTIQFEGHLSSDLLIHELVHVWQYQRVGAVYIVRALYALHLDAAYDYGGATNLLNEVNVGKELFDYNYEQQAQIVQDYYRLQSAFDSQRLMAAHNQYLYAYQMVLQAEDLLT